MVIAATIWFSVSDDAHTPTAMNIPPMSRSPRYPVSTGPHSSRAK